MLTEAKVPYSSDSLDDVRSRAVRKISRLPNRKVIFHRQAYDTILRAMHSRMPAESMGALVGGAQLLRGGRRCLVVEEAVPMQLLPSGPGLVANMDEWTALTARLAERKDNKKRIIGWFCSDPGAGIFPPRIDVTTTQHALGPDAELFLFLQPVEDEATIHIRGNTFDHPEGEEVNTAPSIILWDGTITGLEQLVSRRFASPPDEPEQAIEAEQVSHPAEQTSDEGNLDLISTNPNIAGIAGSIPDLDIPAHDKWDIAPILPLESSPNGAKEANSRTVVGTSLKNRLALFIWAAVLLGAIAAPVLLAPVLMPKDEASAPSAAAVSHLIASPTTTQVAVTAENTYVAATEETSGMVPALSAPWAATSPSATTASTATGTPTPSATPTPEPPTFTPTTEAPTATHTTVPATSSPVPVLPTPTHLPPKPTAPKPAPPRIITYRVVAGDNLSTIARRYGTTVEALMAANRLGSKTIYAGQILVVGRR